MSARKKTHYQLLGINSDVSREEIKRAYRRLVKDQHPDTMHHDDSGRRQATEEMMALNEAYETLMDAAKRAEYDSRIGANRSQRIPRGNPTFTSLDEDQQRATYLKKVFNPARTSINRVLGMYKKQLRDLSADPFDDILLQDFEAYVDQVEDTLRNASNSFTQNPAPRSLEGAVQMMRYAIAQAADGLEEMRYYCQNYDHNHLTMTENLFRIYGDLSKQAYGLTKQ